MYKYQKGRMTHSTALCPFHPEYCTPYLRWLQQILGMNHQQLLHALSETWIGSILLMLLHFQRESDWLTQWVNEWVNEPVSPPVCSCCPDSALHLSQSLNSSSCSCCQSVVFPRLMVRYSWWKQSLGKAL